MTSVARLVCPYCATAAIEAMPADACQHFYDCSGCGRRLAPKDGDCCVFCSYADTPCPPVQGDYLPEKDSGAERRPRSRSTSGTTAR